MTKLKSALPAAVGLLLLSNVLLLTQRNTAQAQSQGTGLAPLLARLHADEETIAALQAKTAPLSLSGRDLTITAVNVHIVSGSGSTSDGTQDAASLQRTGGHLTGLGNLIIGYDEAGGIPGRDRHTGSHNLILGDRNGYSSFGGLVAGENNAISGPYASVSSGEGNTASGDHASVSGGSHNAAGGEDSSVSGGARNSARGLESSVGGGDYNRATGYDSSVVGGDRNRATGYEAAVGGGEENTADGEQASVGGGDCNTAGGKYASVSGGGWNRASGYTAAVSGGGHNAASGLIASITGGDGNTAAGLNASVGGGEGRHVSQNYGWAAGSPAPVGIRPRGVRPRRARPR